MAAPAGVREQKVQDGANRERRGTRAPLSQDLRDFPQSPFFAKRKTARDYPFGGGREGGIAFQKLITFAVLLPESFRGGCSFGACFQVSPARDRLYGRTRAPHGGRTR